MTTHPEYPTGAKSLARLLLRGLSLVAALAVAAISSAQTTITWTDSFDGTFGALASDSFAWRQIGGTDRYSYSGGDMVLANNDRAALGYFTNSGSSAQLVNVGDSITMTINFYYQATGNNTAGDRLRFGLLQSVANPAATGSASYFTPNIIGGANTEARISESTTGGSASSSTPGIPFANNYTGFVSTIGPSRSSAGTVAAGSLKLYERNVSNASIMGDGTSLGGAYTNIPIADAAGYSVPAGGWFGSANPLTATIQLSLVEIGDGSNKLDYSFSLAFNATIYESVSISGWETSMPLSFDTVALYIQTPLINLKDITITQFSVPAPVPEPSTYAALVGVVALGVVAYRRRKAAVGA